MNSMLRWKTGLSLVVLLLGLAYLLPSIPGVKDSSLGKVLPSDTINLGLDLKGGIHLTLGVDLEKAVDIKLSSLGQDLRADARDEDIVVLKPKVNPNETLEMTLLTSDKQGDFEDLLKENFSVLTIENKQAQDGGRIRYTFAMTPKYRKFIDKMTLDQTVKTITNRIDQFGVAEPDIRRQGSDRIQVQLPGLQDPERAIKIIGKTAHLEFKMVDDNADIEKAVKGIVAPGRELSVLLKRKPDGTYAERPIVLHKDTVLTGEYITDAQPRFDQFGSAYVVMDFNGQGGRIFERLTANNTGKQLAIVLDGKVYSAPVIREKISGGSASITGTFTDAEAHDLAIVLRAGSLPAPVKILEQRTVGPSLGQESIDKGVTAALIGMCAVLIFMAIYYGVAGLIADVVLCMNIVLIMAALAGFGATLTLPGIAGIILTIGMAVDANVIIFERIREELRKGLTPRAAVAEGYGRATLTILDANVTTVIAAIILYQFGTGPIRGFAVTLTLGILTSMFTAIFVSRVMFEMYLAKRSDNAKLSI